MRSTYLHLTPLPRAQMQVPATPSGQGQQPNEEPRKKCVASRVPVARKPPSRQDRFVKTRRSVVDAGIQETNRGRVLGGARTICHCLAPGNSGFMLPRRGNYQVLRSHILALLCASLNSRHITRMSRRSLGTAACSLDECENGSPIHSGPGHNPGLCCYPLCGLVYITRVAAASCSPVWNHFSEAKPRLRFHFGPLWPLSEGGCHSAQV